ncbi:hypothetical protein T01_14129 [Trichinella spiralis]|uniref:Uncharacterized protein n=1 Tax=Trichinella spiralis TaxID=6334 RepID=A0A0V1AZP7_TRISP|nr:hypothetical protein T01_14129 [Trichinella spiralis]
MSSYSWKACMGKAQNLQVYNMANGAASLIRHPRLSTHNRALPGLLSVAHCHAFSSPPRCAAIAPN